MANFLKNLITGTAKNLITNTLNNAINKNSSTNVKGASVTQPTQYKTPAQPPVQTTTQVKTTPIIQNVKPVNTQYATPANSTPAVNNQSRFIGFQNNFWVQNQFTQQAQNVINWNTAQQNIKKAWERKVFPVYTHKQQVADYNKIQDYKYRTREEAIKDFHYDVRNTNGQLTAEDIAEKYPEFKNNVQDALKLQEALLPYVRDDEFAPMKAITENFPNLLPAKQQKTYDDSQDKKFDERINYMKTQTNYDALSDYWKVFYDNMMALNDVAERVRKNYKVWDDATNLDIILTAINNEPTDWESGQWNIYKKIYDDMIMAGKKLDNSDLRQLSKWNLKRWMNNPIMELQAELSKKMHAWSQQWNELIREPLNQIAEEAKQSIQNTKSLPDFNKKYLEKAIDATNAIVNIPWTAISWADRVLTNKIQLSNWNDTKSFWKNISEKLENITKIWWWAIETFFNTVASPVTVWFHAVWATPVAWDILNSVFESVPNAVDFYMSGKWRQTLADITLWDEWTRIWDLLWVKWEVASSIISDWYNNELDDQGRADFQNSVFMLLWWAKWKTKWKTPTFDKLLTNGKINAWAIADWIIDTIKQWKNRTSFSLFLKKKMLENDRTQMLPDRPWKVNDNVWYTDYKGWQLRWKDYLDAVTEWVWFAKNRFIENFKEWWNVDKAIEQRKAYEANKETIQNWEKAWSPTIKEWQTKVWPVREEWTEITEYTGEYWEPEAKAPEKWVVEKVKEWVKNTVENINNTVKNSFSNLIKRKSWNQEQQSQQWFSKSWVTDNWLNQLNNTKNIGEVNTKPLNNAQNQLIQNYNRMNPKAIQDFETRYWESYWQYMADRWFTKAWEDNLNDMVTYQKDLMNIKENALNKIDWKFNDVAIQDMLDVLNDFYTKTKDRKNLAMIQNLINKHNNGGLSMSEINNARKKFQYDIRTNFFKDWNSEKIQLANNVYLAVKDFLDKTAKENWLDSLDDINREIMKVQHIIWWVSYKMRWSSANNTLWLTDYITLASMLSNPAWLAVFLWKQALKTNWVKNFILDKAIGRKWNAKNRITADKMQYELERIEKINDEKARDKALEEFYNKFIKPVKELSEYFDNSVAEFKRQFNESIEKWTLDNALPDKRSPLDEWKNVITGKNQVTIEVDEQGNSRRKGQISESDKRSEENKKDWYIKSESEPKNLVTAKPKEEAPKEEPKKPEVKKKKEVKPKNEVTTKQPVKEAPAEKTEWMVTVDAWKGKTKEVPMAEVTKRWVDLNGIDLKQIKPENVDDIISKAEWWYKFYKDSKDWEFIQALDKNWELVMSYWYWPEYAKLFKRIADKWNKEHGIAETKPAKEPKAETKQVQNSKLKDAVWDDYYNWLERQVEIINNSNKKAESPKLKEPITVDDLDIGSDLYLNKFEKLHKEKLLALQQELSDLNINQADTKLTPKQQKMLEQAKSEEERQWLLEKWRREYLEKNQMSDEDIAKVENIMNKAHELVEQREKYYNYILDWTEKKNAKDKITNTKNAVTTKKQNPVNDELVKAQQEDLFNMPETEDIEAIDRELTAKQQSDLRDMSETEDVEALDNINKKNTLTAKKWDFNLLSRDEKKSTLKQWTILSATINWAESYYQIESVDWDSMIIRNITKWWKPMQRVKLSKDIFVDEVIKNAESITYDNWSSRKIIESDLPVFDMEENFRYRKEQSEKFEKLWLKTWDYISMRNWEAYKVKEIKGWKLYYEDAKTWEEKSDFIENITRDFDAWIAEKWTESDFNAVKEKEQTRQNEIKAKEEEKARKEQERLEPIQSYLDTVINAGQKTKAREHLLANNTWTDLSWKRMFWNRAKMLRSLIDEWYTLKVEETGKFYPNGTPKVEYHFVEPDGNKYYTLKKIDFDYVEHQLENNAKVEEEKMPENTVTTEEENHLFKKEEQKPNNLTESEIIKKHQDNIRNKDLSPDELTEEVIETYKEIISNEYNINSTQNWYVLNLIDRLFDENTASATTWWSVRWTFENSYQLRDRIKEINKNHNDAIKLREEETQANKEEASKAWLREKFKEESWNVSEEIPEWRIKEIVKPWTVFSWEYNWNKDFYLVEKVEDWKMYVIRHDAEWKPMNDKANPMDFDRWWELLSNAWYKYDNTWKLLWPKNAITNKTEVKQPKNAITSKSKVDEIIEKANGAEIKVSLGSDWDSYLVIFNADGKDQAFSVTDKQLKELNDKWANFKNADERADKQAKINEEMKKNIEAFDNGQPKNLVTSKKQVEAPTKVQEKPVTTEWKIQETDKETYRSTILKNPKEHPWEMFIYKDWSYYYPSYVLPSWKIITPENTYWWEVSSEKYAREWLQDTAKEYSAENEAIKTGKLQNSISKTAEKYEETLKRIESDNPMYEIWTSWDYFKYWTSNSQMAKAKKEADANAQVWTFKKDVIDSKEWYRIFVSWSKTDAIWAFYEPKTWKTYRIYRWPTLDDSRPFTTKQVDRIEKFLWNVEKQLEKETKKEKVEKKDVITQEWLDSLKPDKDGVVELQANDKERYVLKRWEESLIKWWKADWKYLYNYATESKPQYWTIYIKDWNVYESMKWIWWEYMTTRESAVEWLNQKEKDVEHEATPRFEKTDYETLPKTVSVEAEAEVAWPKRIAPDRVKWQQETYDKGLENVKDVIKAKRVVFSDLWFKSLRGKAVKDIWEEKQRIEKLPESEAEIQWNELARGIYEDLVIKDISKWYRYPEDVTSKFPKAQIQKAVDARARYEKWLFTSFSNKDTRANYQYKDEIWAGIKSQDWKPVTQEQMNEIVDGIRSFGGVFWLDMKKFAEDNNIIYVHLHGWNPFLMWGWWKSRWWWMNIAWLYRRWADWNISISLWWVELVMEKWEDWEMKKNNVNATPEHELAHAFDYMLDNKLFSSQDIEILKKTMNKPTRLINYYNRSQEIVARAVEQYAAKKTWKSRYGRPYKDSQAYWNEENFDKYVKPIVEKNMKEKLWDYSIKDNKSEESTSKNAVTANSKNELTSKSSLKESMPRNVLTANVDNLLKKTKLLKWIAKKDY